jgi:hypothetical protein
VETAPPTPADELATLQRMVAERDAELAMVRARLGRASVEIEHLRAQLAALRRARYGRSSEKLEQAIAQLELRLEDLEEGEC